MSNNNKNSKSLSSIIKQSARVVGDKDNKVSKSKSSKKDKVLSADSVTSDSPDFMTSSAIKLHDVIYPCKDKELYTRVMLKPHQMNDDLYLGLKKILLKQLRENAQKMVTL